ncbi:hypothetical protein LRP30_21680 [Bradyrhizobium sp. C-145]|uniref:hypothetical protein n=1 Tax=Bradyrhizobium sp. C-145 TaxID=574727 RepID=UPI00201B86FF|nr:hypothetical protein [Bradyrhizobium sp. C-145]UQR67701.1 hypothetical protein LRP30_21680 [Bradyrhizobium sp. C-145]
MDLLLGVIIRAEKTVARQREPAGPSFLSLQPSAVRHQPLPVALPVRSMPALHSGHS